MTIRPGQSGTVKFARLEILEHIGRQAAEYKNHKYNQISCPCGLSRPIQILFKCFYCYIFFCGVCASDHFKTINERMDSIVSVKPSFFCKLNFHSIDYNLYGWQCRYCLITPYDLLLRIIRVTPIEIGDIIK